MKKSVLKQGTAQDNGPKSARGNTRENRKKNRAAQRRHRGKWKAQKKISMVLPGGNEKKNMCFEPKGPRVNREKKTLGPSGEDVRKMKHIKKTCLAGEKRRPSELGKGGRNPGKVGP